jgi:hypothetical protein
VQWGAVARTTQDVDLAGDTNMSIAIPDLRADIPSVLESLHMGFFPVPRLSHLEPSTSFAIRGKTLRLDLLTPMKRGQTAPVFIRRFNAAAQPLKYLDYLIQNPVDAAMIAGTSCLVKVPQPARFALHKLIVSQERNITAADKKKKDMVQAAALIDLLKEVRPGDLAIARDELAVFGTSWVRKLKSACKEARIDL